MSHNDMAAVARANEEKPAPTLELQRSEDGSALIPDMRPTMEATKGDAASPGVPADARKHSQTFNSMFNRVPGLQIDRRERSWIAKLFRATKLAYRVNMFSIAPAPEWSWDRSADRGRAKNVNNCCYEPWEDRYGTWTGLGCSVIIAAFIVPYAVMALWRFADQSEVFLQRQTVGLTHTQDPPTISLPTIATFFRDSRYRYMYDERYIRVSFEQRYIYYSDTRPSEFPRRKVRFNNTLCPILGAVVQEAAAICPDVAQSSDSPHIRGDYADDQYQYFQVNWRSCDNTSDAGPKLVVLANSTSYYLNEPCASTAEIDKLIYNSGKVNRSMGLCE